MDYNSVLSTSLRTVIHDILLYFGMNDSEIQFVSVYKSLILSCSLNFFYQDNTTWHLTDLSSHQSIENTLKEFRDTFHQFDDSLTRE